MNLLPAPSYFGWDIAKKFCLTSNGTILVALDGYGGIHIGSTATSAEAMPPPLIPYFGWDTGRDVELAYSSGGQGN